MKIKACEDFVFIKPAKVKDRTEGGILLPESVTEQDHPQCGIVVAAGPGTYRQGIFIPNHIHEGDIVLHGSHIGGIHYQEGNKYKILNAPQIWAKLDELPTWVKQD